MEQTKGQKLLKTVGLILIVFGAFVFVMYGIALALVLFGRAVEEVAVEDRIIGVFIAVVIWALLLMASGVVAIRNRHDAKASRKCFYIGIVLMVADVVLCLLQCFPSPTWQALAQGIGGLIIPGLYTYGAYLCAHNL